MKNYQIIIEGVFIGAAELGDAAGGFHTTFYTRAISASGAAHNVSGLLVERMHRHKVSEIYFGLFKTYFIISHIWEITEEIFEKREKIDSGFTFFRIFFLSRFYLLIRHIIFKRYKPWLLVDR